VSGSGGAIGQRGGTADRKGDGVEEFVWRMGVTSRGQEGAAAGKCCLMETWIGLGRWG
jgi:hypothetical protein